LRKNIVGPGATIKPLTQVSRIFHQHFQRTTATNSALRHVDVWQADKTLKYEHIPVARMLHK